MEDIKMLFSGLGFTPKENASGIFSKKYAESYVIEVDNEKETINYGNLIISDSKTTQNFSQPENFVVLECVDRLLTKGYKPENIILEKTYPAGHGTSGRLDICVTRDDGSEYLLIECKTFGKEFDKEFARMKRDGGQLFTYFKFSNKADVLMLYASELQTTNGATIAINGASPIVGYRNEIVKIEDDYRFGDVRDFYEKWNKLTYDSGEWENPPYDFHPDKYTKNNLRELNETEGQSLFNKFAVILRKHSVSDKPNAFNKIFNLFLAKLYDEQKKQNDELEFHWRNDDNPVDFQVRLFNLHTKGLYAFLEKELAGIHDEDFEGYKSKEELLRKKKNLLKLNKIYDIKEVFDDDTFEQNHRVLKEVVELLQQYQIRYPRKQRHLSEFFEQLLTTGLKQEAGQYFTPPVIAKFIVRSLPLPEMLEKEINQPAPSLPAALDYAAGSGHFITEILEEYQDIIEKLDTSDFYPKAQKEVAAWKADPYNWAAKYVYGVEKDYRLVKVAKVGCYFYGDGLAQIVLGDGLDSFEKSKSYVGLLKENAKKPQFSILVSNPPYSVDYCKDDLEYIGSQNEFTLFQNLTDNSSEIEALFVERAAQLLKENGIAGIVLPSSILSNKGIHAKAREIILQNFDIVAIVQLGDNTFMATNTNTVVLFLRKRSETHVNRIKEAAYRIAENYPKTHEDLTINGIEKPVHKYLEHTKETEINPEKFYYFALNYHQKTVIVKTGDKEDEKRFLGYKIIKRRGNEGYHAIQSGKFIDECTCLFDDKNPENPEKANTYIYKAFKKEYPAIHETLKNNVFHVDLIDLLTFDRDNFDKNISLAVEKKVKIESKWDIVKLSEIALMLKRGKSAKYGTSNIQIIKSGQARGIKEFDFSQKYFVNEGFVLDERKLETGDVLINSTGVGTAGRVTLFDLDGIFVVDSHITILRPQKEKILPKFVLYSLVRMGFKNIEAMAMGQSGQIELSLPTIQNIEIPLPPKEIQEKIVAEIEVFETKEDAAKKEIEEGKEKISEFINNLSGSTTIKDYFDINTDTFNPTEVWENEYFTYIDIDNVGKGNGSISFNQRLLGKNAPSRARRLAKNNTAVISTVRPYLKGFAFISSVPDKTIFSTGFALLKSKSEEKYITKLIYLLFQFSNNLMKQMEDAMPKSAYPSINKEDIENFEIPLPPFSEQQKIVAEIEKIESQIAVLEQEVADIPKQKEEVLKKYL